MNKQTLINRIDKRYSKLLELKNLKDRSKLSEMEICNCYCKITKDNVELFDFDFHDSMNKLFSKRDAYILSLPKNKRKEVAILLRSYEDNEEFIDSLKSINTLKDIINNDNTIIIKDKKEIFLTNDSLSKFDKESNLRSYVDVNFNLFLYKSFELSESLVFIYEKNLIKDGIFQDVKFSKNIIKDIAMKIHNHPKYKIENIPDTIKNYLIIQ